jgi:hypothetical protein
MLGLTVPRVTVRASTRHHSRPVLNAAGPRFGLPSQRLLLAHACAAPEQRVARTAEPEVAVPLTRPCIARQEASCLPSLLFYHTLNQSPFRYSIDKVACSCTPCVVSCCARTARAIGKCGWGWCDSCFIIKQLTCCLLLTARSWSLVEPTGSGRRRAVSRTGPCGCR